MVVLIIYSILNKIKWNFICVIIPTMKKWLPVLLSLFLVGGGQLIKGRGEKAVKFMLLFYFTLPALLYVSLMISGGLFVVVFGVVTVFAVIFWMYNIFDAYQVV